MMRLSSLATGNVAVVRGVGVGQGGGGRVGVELQDLHATLSSSSPVLCRKDQNTSGAPSQSNCCT